MTNADKLRSMTDDELVSVLLDERCEKCATSDNCPDMQPCCDEIVEWLKSPVDL